MAIDKQAVLEQLDQDTQRFRGLVNGDENDTVELEQRTEKSVAGQVKERVDEVIVGDYIRVANWEELSGSFSPPLIVRYQRRYHTLTNPVSEIENEKPNKSPHFSTLAVTTPRPGDDGSDLDGLTFEDMEDTGNYDPISDTGFFGEVAASTLFTGPEIKTELGITLGTPINDEEPWLKFWNKGQVIYVNKKPIQHSISWDHIYSRGAVYGTNDDGLFPRGTPTNQFTQVSKNGNTFTVRLLTGAASDPIDTTNRDQPDSCTFDLGGGSEWNELIYRIHQDEPFCGDPSHDTLHGGAQVGGNWASYSNADLGVVSGDGRGSWTQETASDSTSFRVFRGLHTSVANFATGTASLANANVGLRLVLQLES